MLCDYFCNCVRANSFKSLFHLQVTLFWHFSLLLSHPRCQMSQTRYLFCLLSYLVLWMDIQVFKYRVVGLSFNVVSVSAVPYGIMFKLMEKIVTIQYFICEFEWPTYLQHQTTECSFCDYFMRWWLLCCQKVQLYVYWAHNGKVLIWYSLHLFILVLLIISCGCSPQFCRNNDI